MTDETTPPEPVDARGLLRDCRELLRASQFQLRIDMAARHYHEQVEAFLPILDAALSTANAPTDALDPIPSSERELLATEPFYTLPFRLVEPKGEEGAMIVDATERPVAMMMWPCHPPDETEAAEQVTYAIGRAFAASTTREPALDLHTRNEALEEAVRQIATSEGSRAHLQAIARSTLRALKGGAQ